MLRQRKQLLGLAGLALVGIMTAVACVISAPDAGAVGNKGEVNVRVQVQNAGKKAQVRIVDFTYEDTDTVFQKRFTAKIEYLQADELKLYLKNTGAVDVGDTSGIALYADENPEEGEVLVDLTGSSCENISYKEVWDSCEVTYDLDLVTEKFELGGMSYRTRAVAMNSEYAGADDDSLPFFYRAAYLMNFDNQYVGNGDPVLEAILSDDVKFAAIEVFDEKGNRVNIPANAAVDGKEYYKLDLDQKDGNSLKFALPLWEAGADAGKYRVVLITYDTETPEDDHMNGLAVAEDVPYTIKNPNKPGDGDELDPNKPGGPNNPNTPGTVEPGKPSKPGDGDTDDPNKPDDPNNPDNPEAPDTGLNLFKDLNISRADYIITGLVAFGLVTGFAIFLIVRRNKR